MKKEHGHHGLPANVDGNRFLQVKVHPGAGRSEISRINGNEFHIKIAAPPEKGKANKELTDFLSRKLDIQKSSISIIRGETSRNKLISVKGLSSEDISRLLLTLIVNRSSHIHLNVIDDIIYIIPAVIPL